MFHKRDIRRWRVIFSALLKVICLLCKRDIFAFGKSDMLLRSVICLLCKRDKVFYRESGLVFQNLYFKVVFQRRTKWTF